MASAAKIAVVLFLATLINHAFAGGDAHGQRCTTADIKVTQEKTGKVVQGQPEYRVTVENLCSCYQAYVQLHCNRLPSVEPIDSRAIKVEDVLCELATDLFQGSPISFTYAWKAPQDFTVVSSKVMC